MIESHLPEQKKYLLTLREFFEKSLYDNAWGYYSSGSVDFKNDFQTFAAEYAPLLAERCFAAWQSLVKTQEISVDEKFFIYEFGAGTGEMAFIFLKYVHGMALTSSDQNWNTFYNVISYQIGEISPSLKERQLKKLDAYMRINKISIHQIDARQLKSDMPKGVGVVVSNELIDAFPVQELKVSLDEKTQTIEVCPMMLAPTISENLLKSMMKVKSEKDIKLSQYKEKMYQLEKNWNIPSEILQKMRKEKRWIVTIQDMENLLTKDKVKFGSDLKMIKWPVTIEALDITEKNNIKQTLEKSEFLLKETLKICKTKTIYVHSAAENYYQHIQTFLKKGYVFTLDYGRNAIDYFEDPYREIYLRTYSSSFTVDKIQHTAASPLECPGQQDITVDVNFSDLAEMGKKYNFETVYFGTQDSLGGFFLRGFRLLIQEHKISGQSAEKRQEILLNGMDKSAPVFYVELYEMMQDIQEGKKYCNNLNFKASPENLSINIKLFLDWLIKTNYLVRNWEYAVNLEYAFIGFIMDIPFYKNDRDFLANYILKLINNEDYAKLLLSIIRHQTYEAGISPEMENKLSFAEEFLIQIEKEIVFLYPQWSGTLANMKSIQDFNFKNMLDAEKSNTHLTKCLHAAVIKIENLKPQLSSSGQKFWLKAQNNTASELDNKELQIQNDNPESIQLKENGNQFFAKKKYKEALGCYDQALKLNLNFKEAWLNKGRCHQQMGNDKDALTAFSQAIKIDPCYTKAVYKKAEILLSVNKVELALNIINKYLTGGGEANADIVTLKQKCEKTYNNSSNSVFFKPSTKNSIQMMPTIIWSAQKYFYVKQGHISCWQYHSKESLDCGFYSEKFYNCLIIVIRNRDNNRLAMIHADSTITLQDLKDTIAWVGKNAEKIIYIKNCPESKETVSDLFGNDFVYKKEFIFKTIEIIKINGKTVQDRSVPDDSHVPDFVPEFKSDVIWVDAKNDFGTKYHSEIVDMIDDDRVIKNHYLQLQLSEYNSFSNKQGSGLTEETKNEIESMWNSSSVKNMIYDFIMTGDYGNIRSLLDSGFNPDTTFNGITMLELANRKGHENLVNLLLSRGASVDILTENSQCNSLSSLKL